MFHATPVSLFANQVASSIQPVKLNSFIKDLQCYTCQLLLSQMCEISILRFSWLPKMPAWWFTKMSKDFPRLQKIFWRFPMFGIGRKTTSTPVFSLQIWEFATSRCDLHKNFSSNGSSLHLSQKWFNWGLQAKIGEPEWDWSIHVHTTHDIHYPLELKLQNVNKWWIILHTSSTGVGVVGATGKGTLKGSCKSFLLSDRVTGGRNIHNHSQGIKMFTTLLYYFYNIYTCS